MVAVGAVTRWPQWGANAALPIFVFWAFIAVLIWLFLLGLSKIANGHYAVTEIIATVFMAGFSVAGAVISIPLGKALRPLQRAFTIALFGVMQVSAMWISFLGPIANR